MFGLGPTELIVIIIIALVIFGPSRLPKVGQSIGQALREFRDSTAKIEDEVKQGIEESASRDESKE